MFALHVLNFVSQIHTHKCAYASWEQTTLLPPCVLFSRLPIGLDPAGVSSMVLSPASSVFGKDNDLHHVRCYVWRLCHVMNSLQA